MAFRTVFSFCCVFALCTQVIAKKPLPVLGNWKWVTDVHVQHSGLDSTGRGAQQLDAEIDRLKEDFERRLKKKLLGACQYSTYENLGHVGTISIRMTASREKELKGKGGGVYTGDGEISGEGPDGLPIRRHTPDPNENASEELLNTNLKLKVGKLKVSGVKALVLDQKEIAIDSIVLSDGKQRDFSQIAEYLVSAMTSVYSRQRLK